MPDAVVVGAGVVGASVALELQRSGRTVVVVDKGEAVGGGTTSASSSVVRFNYSTLAGTVAAWESRHRWDDWAGHLGHVDGPLAAFHRTGLLMLEPPGADRSPVLGHLDVVGVPYGVLDPDGLAAALPALDTGRFWPPRLPDDDRFFDEADGRLGGWTTPDAGFVDDPQLAAANLMDAARHHGAEVRLRTRVVGVDAPAGRVAGVRLDDGTALSAPVVVNAAGPWSTALNRLAGVDGDLAMAPRALRQEVHVADAPPGFALGDGGTMLADLDLGFYVRPQPGGTLIAGGLEADCDPEVWVDDPDDDPPTPTVAVWQAHTWRLARRIPAVRVPNRPAGLASHYDVTPDWSPVYDRSSLAGFYLAIGTSGNQFKNAPLVGELLRTLIDACEAGHDHDADPVRVDLSHTGRILDLGAFARNREPAATTGTVLG